MSLTKVSYSMINGSAASPLDFGAVGNGIADDTTAVQAAIDNAPGNRVDLLGLTYKITSTLTLPSNAVIYNGTLNGSTMASGDTLMEAFGTLGSSVSMNTINSTANTFVVSSATGISANTVLYLESSTIFGSGGTYNGELIQVKSISGTTVTPYRRVYDYYLTGQKFYIPTMKKNIYLQNVKFIGGGNGKNHIAFHAYLAKNVVLEGCSSEYFGDRHFQFQRSMNCRATGCNAEHSDTSTGLAYGFTAVNGCDNITFTGCTGKDVRHGVTIGGERGVDRNVTVSGCTFTECTDAAIDCHPQSQFIVFNGNVCGAFSTESTQDGITAQGTDVVVTNNLVQGFSRIGILLQPLCVNSSFGDTTLCTGNNINNPYSSTDVYGIAYDNQRTGNNAEVNISGNNVNTILSSSSNGILIEINSAGSTVLGLTITGNTVFTRRYGIRLFTAANKLIGKAAISGNTVETLATTTYDAINITATTNNYIERVFISGNNIYGGAYGIKNTQGSRVVAYSNMIQQFGTAETTGLTDAANNYAF